MAYTDLSAFFRPHGVAVIGASRDPDKLGYAVVHNLVQNGFSGAIYPVNPRASTIKGFKTYSSILEVPDPLDLAIVILPAPYVTAALEQCGQRGVRNVIIPSGGFRETGAEGAAREEELKRIAARYSIDVLGPNCIGSIDAHTPLNATFVPMFPSPGDIAIISQSGALAASMIDWCSQRGIGLSRVVSLGNQAGVTETDILKAIHSDEYTRVVSAYIEGVSDGPGFVEAARQVARDMPIIALKVGQSAGAARAVSSHTGALAGSATAYQAAFERAGVLRASNLEQMLDWARALAWQPLPRGNRVGVLTNAGGLGILAVEALEAHGMALAPLTEATRAYLRERVQPAASVENPVDILAGAGPTTYALCLDALLADETVDAVVVMTAPQDWFKPVSLAEVVGEVANSPLGRKKPVLAVIMGLGSEDSEERNVLRRKRVPNYNFPEQVGSTLAAMWERRRWLDAQDGRSEAADLGIDRETARMALQAAREVSTSPEESLGGDGPSGWIKPDQVAILLRAYGIDTPASGLAPNVEHALRLASTVGYPVVAKLAASGLVHKTDIGGVVLNIKTPEELQAACEAIMARAREKAPDLTIVEGVYVQHMERGVAEVIAGVVRDPVFGPLVMVGLGGTQVELLRDVAFGLAPLTRRDVEELLDRTAAGRALAGWRGSGPADRAAVVDAVLRLAQIALDFPEIAEIEINPIIALAEGQGVRAVDARVRLAL